MAGDHAPGGAPAPAAGRLATLIATGLGTGWLPVAPGSWGSLIALPPAWLLVGLGGPWLLLIAAALLFALGQWATGRHMVAIGRHDPGEVVVDEIVGQWATLLVCPLDPLAYALGFLLFRLADVVKPWPVGWLDRHVRGAFGVMVDDLGAAIYAGVPLLLIGLWWWP